MNNRASTLTPRSSPLPLAAPPALLNRTVSPAELRAIGSSPTSTQTVWLPSMMRCSRSQVVNGSRRSACGGASAASSTTRPKLPACSTSVSALIGLLERALVQVAAQAGIGHDVAADPEQPVEIDAGRGGRRDVEHVERIDERDELAARGGRREHLQQQARAARRSRADELGELAARKPAAQPRVQRRNAGRGRRRIHQYRRIEAGAGSAS